MLHEIQRIDGGRTVDPDPHGRHDTGLEPPDRQVDDGPNLLAALGFGPDRHGLMRGVRQGLAPVPDDEPGLLDQHAHQVRPLPMEPQAFFLGLGPARVPHPIDLEHQFDHRATRAPTAVRRVTQPSGA
jgi:hypothetical protein